MWNDWYKGFSINDPILQTDPFQLLKNEQWAIVRQQKEANCIQPILNFLRADYLVDR